MGLQIKLQKLRDNKAFELFVIGVIVFSSVMIGVKTYELSSFMSKALWVMDYAITVFFLIEIIIRMIAEKKFLQFFKKGWNIFDSCIVAISLIPLENSEYALIARMLRLFRVMRLISFIPELRVLVTALLTALPRMGYVALLMFIIFYIYAVVGNVLFAEINPVLWGDLGISLLTLFRVATFEDWTDVMYEVMEVYGVSWIYFITFIFFSAFIFLNMMIGIVLEVLSEEHNKMNAVTEEEHQHELVENQATMQQQIELLNKKMDTLIKLSSRS